MEPHERFARSGDDLVVLAEVGFVEAAMGGHVDDETPDGPVQIEIPAGTQNGQRFRLRKRGMPRVSGGRQGRSLGGGACGGAHRHRRPGAGSAAWLWASALLPSARRGTKGRVRRCRGRDEREGTEPGGGEPAGTGKYYMISVVAKAYGIHPQTLRLYEREGLLTPSRTEGNTRLYSEADLRQLEVILNLTRDLGVNLAGVEIVLNLRRRIEQMQTEVGEFVAGVQDELRRANQEGWQERLQKALVRLPPAPHS